MEWLLEERTFELKYKWTISRGSANAKTNFFIRCMRPSQNWGQGEAAPNVRYGETPEMMRAGFELLSGQGSNAPKEDYLAFSSWLRELELPSALSFAADSAWVHAYCTEKHMDVSEFLGLPQPGIRPFSFSLPIMPAAEIEAFWHDQNLGRFQLLKLKINSQEGLALAEALRKVTRQPLLVDANEGFTDPDEALWTARELKKLGVRILEQPMPAAMAEEYRYMKPRCPLPLLADESLTQHTDPRELIGMFHGINVKLMKAGSYRNGIHQLRIANGLGMTTMIGCMVETSLGISSAYRLSTLADYADLDGFLIMKEDPFGLVSEENGLLRKSWQNTNDSARVK